MATLLEVWRFCSHVILRWVSYHTKHNKTSKLIVCETKGKASQYRYIVMSKRC